MRRILALALPAETVEFVPEADWTAGRAGPSELTAEQMDWIAGGSRPSDPWVATNIRYDTPSLTGSEAARRQAIVPSI
jgi:hypothetical protein